MKNYLTYRLPSIKDKRLMDPHVVILGAGASIAACPIDKNGKKVPLLSNIHRILGLTDELKKYNFSDKEMDNFELMFSKIFDKVEYDDLKHYLEIKVSEYFQSLKIPDNVTVYDYLILSLTEKDAIITFNWDPFLIQAYRRNLDVGNLPQLIFPHGNVGVGLCDNCKNKGYTNCLCPDCLKPLEDMPLLYPVHKKNYYDNGIIQNEWQVAQTYLSRAAGITVFGYGAPETDIEAFNLLRDSYKKSNIDTIAPFTIINLAKEEVEQKKKWSAIYDERMFLYATEFSDSLLWTAPRVSLEYMFDAILQQQPREDTKTYEKFATLVELQNFVRNIDAFDMAI